ncbi:MAG: cyclic 2,3-diphosphoglycerate synthase [Gemmatimonadota bacterium]|nr:cyclic 2,3-diphosphoglycerate synthase [Gemmatimonadota bacterium]
MPQRAIILGAAGRDFHNFNTYFRGNPDYEVVAFTATQIPNIEGRRYPAELAGDGYPDGIPIVAEDELESLVLEHEIDVVVFAYSDVTHEHVMHLASRAIAAGANYLLLGARQTMVASTKPVVAVCAARTGSGKSQTSRRVARLLTEAGKKVVVVRHPMPYGDLVKQAVQRFETYDDLDAHEVTIEEREEYEPHIDAGRIVYAGVDYEAILRQAEQEADVVIWDGGNNDLPFYRPDVFIVVVDPHRPDHAAYYHPGETNVRMADAVVINKVDTADLEDIEIAREITVELNPEAVMIEAASPLFVEDGASLRGKRVLVVEDGPTLTHGEMSYGAGWVAARRFGAAEIIDPRPFAVGSIAATYEKYPTTGDVLPAMGYGDEQVAELAETIQRSDAEAVVIGTPIDLRRLIEIDRPSVRVRYELQEIGEPTLEDVLKPVL